MLKQKQEPVILRLVFARPEAKAITAPKANREENGVVFDGGETGSTASVLKMARRSHAVM
ncbi:hypothetical protein SESBI_17933 [Sesbania bispinosa]|nr:hypothetical protein SESBI_17933 [Sesbania bispinosa]